MEKLQAEMEKLEVMTQQAAVAAEEVRMFPVCPLNSN
jgi:hypothetical protein